MGKIYKDDVGTMIYVNCGQDITGATATKLKVKKPSGTEVEWTATVDGTTQLRYITGSGDIDESGAYLVQSNMTLSGWTGLGETATFTVYEPYT